jgi:hypothetical protein
MSRRWPRLFAIGAPQAQEAILKEAENSEPPNLFKGPLAAEPMCHAHLSTHNTLQRQASPPNTGDVSATLFTILRQSYPAEGRAAATLPPISLAYNIMWKIRTLHNRKT